MNIPFNILLSCAGRRNYLIDYFQKALGAGGEVFAADASPHAPSVIEANGRGIVLPPVTEPGYFDRLLEGCRGNNVRMLLSLNDFELPLLAREAARFREAGIIPVVSDPEFVDLCFDKWRTFEHFKALDVPTPETCLGLAAAKAALRDGRLRFPLVIKPRWGTASFGVEIVADAGDLEAAYAWTMRKIQSLSMVRVGGQTPDEKILIQQALEGQEYGVDIVNDLAGSHRAVIVKRKLSMRAGETDRAVVEPHEGVAALARTVAQALKPRGLTDCDAFVTVDGAFLLELNPRFGGGYPFSHAAGADVPAALLAWAQGRQARPEWLTARPGTLSAKCDRLVSK
jgi:carbamoyl-phosphate synthase large subunit